MKKDPVIQLLTNELNYTTLLNSKIIAILKLRKVYDYELKKALKIVDNDMSHTLDGFTMNDTDEKELVITLSNIQRSLKVYIKGMYSVLSKIKDEPDLTYKIQMHITTAIHMVNANKKILTYRNVNGYIPFHTLYMYIDKILKINAEHTAFVNL